MSDVDLDELRSELDDFAQSKKSSVRSAAEERIIAGFEEIERFVKEYDRFPQHGDDCPIFERLYAVRLDRLRKSPEYREILEPLDSHGLLDTCNDVVRDTEDITDEELLATLKVERDPKDNITQLNYVRSRQEIKAAEEIAQRTPCEDFEEFQPLFEGVQQQLTTGERQTVKYQDNAEVQLGDWFILDGHKVLVAQMGEMFTSDYGRTDCRLRVIYDNGTESNLLLRSLQRALNKDKTSRRISKIDFGPLFSQTNLSDSPVTGSIYVLRSDSDHPFIAKNRSIIHKIGVTTGDVKTRVANAQKDPTYLLADVEIVCTFKLEAINPQRLEALLHKFFAAARLEVNLPDRFEIPVQPREWFLVPLEVIEQAIEKVQDGTLTQFQYDPETASLRQV
ncbi:GIY-YIG nuclease family protein [Geitlerinema sp. P-1104]|uniref:GIY-YIG nuclease family protein n=1 Tax=Geitlerinema sp. P-1104 TaxID=2546230 RepID=UPI002570C002|nr:GIY-YIG nuclease family protein [Geitlerinema sp. P-1104]